MKYFLIVLIILLSLRATAQQSDSQLAYNYYQAKDYAKAAELFLQLYERTHAASYLDFHIVCLINAKEYDRAEETLKKYLKQDDSNRDFLLNLGYIYEQQGKINKSEECYEKAIKKLIPNQTEIQNLASKFQSIRQYDWANKTYLRGRELLKKPSVFSLEIGDNYMLDRNYEKMTDIFFETLEQNPGQINTITSKLGYAKTYDIGNNVDEVVRKKLAGILKKTDYNPVFDELSVWFALQTGDYPGALSYAVRLNSKMADKLYIYINIAREAARAKKYTVAEDAYNRILQKGKENNSLYLPARKELIQCKYSACTEHKTDPAQYKVIAEECENFMKESGYNIQNTDMVTLLSDIYAYRLNLPDTANSILKKGESVPRLDLFNSNMLKTKRADLLTFINHPWEAIILYTQIEKANPNNDAGYEAKLKKAWLAYYEGDLLWAKAQFDVLKGSTSKLISNDAIKISHFINSNYEPDGENKELSQMAKTEYLVYRKQYKTALPVLDSLIDNETLPGIADYASLIKAGVLLSEFNDKEAEVILEKLKAHSEQTYIRAEAIYKLAGIKQNRQDRQQAMELYKTLVSEYSGSVYSIEAGKRYRELEKE